MSTLLAWPEPTEQHGSDTVAAYADLDPVLLASLRTAADEAAMAAAVEVQLTNRAIDDAPVVPLATRQPRRRATDEQRAA